MNLVLSKWSSNLHEDTTPGSISKISVDFFRSCALPSSTGAGIEAIHVTEFHTFAWLPGPFTITPSVVSTVLNTTTVFGQLGEAMTVQ